MTRTAPASKKAPGQKVSASKRKEHPRSLAEVVGPEVYQVWVSMLRTLIPEGRTHRLAPLLAAMLQYALTVASERRNARPAEGSLVQSLLDSTETSDAAQVHALLHDAVERLFQDAGVQYRRTSARGQSYSIAEDAYEEYIRWYDMPWQG